MKLMPIETPADLIKIEEAYQAIVKADKLTQFKSMADHPVNQDRDEMDIIEDILGNGLTLASK